MTLHTLRFALPLIVVSACTTTPAPAPDGGTDGGTSDSTPPDTALPDTAPGDAGTDGGMDAVTDDTVTDDVTPDRPVPPDVTRTATEAMRATQRQSCAFGTGAWAVETMGAEVPVGNQMPVDHVLVVMQENRSFDHYFRTLPAAGQTDVDVASDTWSNPRADGTAVTFHRDTLRCIRDVQHDWASVHAQVHNGAMDGFVTTNDPMGDRALTYFDHTDLPFYSGVATTFAIGDRYFASVPGPTWPNRLYLMAGTSFGLAHNTLVTQDTRMSPVSHVFSRMDDGGITWKDYAGGPRMVAFFPYYGLFRADTRPHLGTITDLMTDLAAGTLPQVAIIEPNYLGNGGNRVDEHPPGIPENGEHFVEGIVRAFMASPAWSRSVMFITYDEHGGFADHVVPPAACPPDALPPVDATGPAAGAFDRYGIRVPFMVVSPYARAHFVSHRTYDHASILRFIEARFDLQALTARDANAAIPTDMLDFAHPPFATPPTLPPAGVVDPATAARCTMQFPSTTGL